MIYVNQLPQNEQDNIINEIKSNLISEGYNAQEIEEAIATALCSKLSDIIN